jgi:hypothetical protein
VIEDLNDLNKQFSESVEKLGATGFQSDLLNVLKEYVDGRFDLLDRKITMLRDYIFEDEKD